MAADVDPGRRLQFYTNLVLIRDQFCGLGHYFEIEALELFSVLLDNSKECARLVVYEGRSHRIYQLFRMWSDAAKNNS
jgi:hypothetical protein